MGMFSRFRRRKDPYAALSDEERMARYVYLLNSLPASVIESAHATAFADLPPEKRRELFAQLRPFMAEGERDAASDDPTVLARLLRRAEEHRARRQSGGADTRGDAATATAVDERDAVDPRSMMLQFGVMGLVANQFLMSAAVGTYYTQGAGSLMIGDEPAWVGETFDPGSIDAAGGGFGGMDGGFGGGFDGGGFGGGFDGGGAF